jgi:hypothetical protein
MAEERTPYVKIALAVAVGIMVGALVSSGDSAEMRKLERRVVEMEQAAEQQAAELANAAQSQAAELRSAAAEQVNAFGAKLDELAAQVEGLVTGEETPAPVEEAVSASQQAIAELRGQLDEMAGQMPDVQADEAFAALSDRVDTLAQQMGQMITSGLAGKPQTPPGGATGTDSSVSTDAAPGEQPPEATVEPEEVGLLLGVGDTGTVGNRRLFVSRIDPDREAVRLMVVGDGPRMLGKGFGPLDLGNGCTVTLKGIVDRMALVVGNCGG